MGTVAQRSPVSAVAIVCPPEPADPGAVAGSALGQLQRFPRLGQNGQVSASKAVRGWWRSAAAAFESGSSQTGLSLTGPGQIPIVSAFFGGLSFS